MRARDTEAEAPPQEHMHILTEAVEVDAKSTTTRLQCRRGSASGLPLHILLGFYSHCYRFQSAIHAERWPATEQLAAVGGLYD